MSQTALALTSLYLPRMSKCGAPPPILVQSTGPGLRSRRCRRPRFLLFSSFISRSWCSLEPHAVIPMRTLEAGPRPFSNPPFQGRHQFLRSYNRPLNPNVSPPTFLLSKNYTVPACLPLEIGAGTGVTDRGPPDLYMARQLHGRGTALYSLKHTTSIITMLTAL